MRPAAHLPSFASSKEGRPRKDDPAARVPLAGGEGAACDARSWGAPRNSLRSSNSAQTSAASQMTKRVCPSAHAPPQLLRFSARSEGGGSGLHSGHCFARPVVLRCARLAMAAAPPVGSAQRDPTPGAAAKQQPSVTPLPTPAGCAEKRRSWGGRVCRRTHTLRRLARRCCLSRVHPQGERREFSDAHPRFEHRRLPPFARQGERGTQTGGRLLFGDFLLATQEKVTAPPGAHPGLRPSSRHAATTNKNPSPTKQNAQNRHP